MLLNKESLEKQEVPIPLFLSYFCAKATTNGKNGISGAITFVHESPTL